MFINQKAVKQHAHIKKRRVSRDFILMLDRMVMKKIQEYINMNSLTTLKP